MGASDKSTQPLEIAAHRDEWIGYLEFAHSNNTHAELTWDQVDHYLDKTDKLRTMITEKGDIFPQFSVILLTLRSPSDKR